MLSKYEIQNVISGTRRIAKSEFIQTISHYLAESKRASTNAEENQFVKEQETKAIIEFAEKNSCFYKNVNTSRFIAEGAEQKVYLDINNTHVIKLNDAIFYLSWQDYFYSLLLHNYFFPTTTYELMGFNLENERVSAVVKQVYITSTQTTDINAIREFILLNGFAFKKNNDYVNNEIGIILEDLHDENILTNNDVLFFIDTVFYLTNSFYSY